MVWRARLANPLLSLLQLSSEEKSARGLEYTPREIDQQPETWKTTYARCISIAPRIEEFLRRTGLGSGTPPVVYLSGAGTSDYIGRGLVHLLRRQWKCDVWALASTTLLTDFESYHQPGKPYLWISFSRSGQSPEGVALLQQALEGHANIHHIVITCNEQGTMARICRDNPERACAVVLDDATNDRGLAMTSSFTNMMIAGQCLGHLKCLPQYGSILEEMIEAAKHFLPVAAETAEAIADRESTRACLWARVCCARWLRKAP